MTAFSSLFFVMRVISTNCTLGITRDFRLSFSFSCGVPISFSPSSLKSFLELQRREKGSSTHHPVVLRICWMSWEGHDHDEVGGVARRGQHTSAICGLVRRACIRR